MQDILRGNIGTKKQETNIETIEQRNKHWNKETSPNFCLHDLDKEVQ